MQTTGANHRLARQRLLEVIVAGGNVLQFAAVGSTSVDAACFAGPDGACCADESGLGVGPAYGIGSDQVPSNALIGVFLDANTSSGAAVPASLDFTDAANTGQASNAPLLNQIFFIGDGQTGIGTGTGTGSFQQFTAPADATRLFLAVADS